MTDTPTYTEFQLNAKIARAFWQQQWRNENPEGSQEDLLKAWENVRSDQMILGRKARRWLEKQGIVLVQTST